MLEFISRFTSFPRRAAPRTSDEILDDMGLLIRAHADRIAAEDMAWKRAKSTQRRVVEGHNCLVISRPSGPVVVPLADLSTVELDGLLS